MLFDDGLGICTTIFFSPLTEYLYTIMTGLHRSMFLDVFLYISTLLTVHLLTMLIDGFYRRNKKDYKLYIHDYIDHNEWDLSVF